jgi:hypothetical protein
VLNIIAVIIGILYTVRKLDVTRRRHEDYPQVGAEAFHAWQDGERLAYTVGSTACFLKVILGSGFFWYVSSGTTLPGTWVRVIGGGIDILWLAAIVWAMVAAARARRRREELGIVLGPVPRPG